MSDSERPADPTPEAIESVPVKLVEALKFFAVTANFKSAPFQHARQLVKYIEDLRRDRDAFAKAAVERERERCAEVVRLCVDTTTAIRDIKHPRKQ